MESWIDMEGNPYFYGLSSHENVEIKLYNKANPLKPWKMMGRMHDKYLIRRRNKCESEQAYSNFSHVHILYSFKSGRGVDT